MSGLIVAGSLLLLLSGSTLWWAHASLVRLDSDAQLTGLARARLWASVLPLILVALLAAAAVSGLFAHGSGAAGRLIDAVASPAIAAGLILCGVAGAYPACLSVRSWVESAGRMRDRLHLSLHLVAIYVVIVTLLVVPRMVV